MYRKVSITVYLILRQNAMPYSMPFERTLNITIFIGLMNEYYVYNEEIISTVWTV